MKTIVILSLGYNLPSLVVHFIMLCNILTSDNVGKQYSWIHDIFPTVVLALQI